MDNSKPLFLQSNNNGYLYKDNLYICAPKTDFIKGLTQVGVEVFKGEYTKISLKSYLTPMPKDPIVLLPVFTKDDVELMVGLNN